MIHEWYSGSDTTGRVPQLVSLYEVTLVEASIEERVENWRTVIDLESDRNWRAAFLSRLGDEQEDVGLIEPALASFREALPLFDPFARNFNDVAADFCTALSGLLRRDDEWDYPAWQKTIVLGFTLLCFRDLGSLPAWKVASAHRAVAIALRRAAAHSDDILLLEMSLAPALRAHKLEPDVPVNLEVLATVLAQLGRTEECQRALDACCAVESDSAEREKVLTMVRHYLPAITAPPRVSM